MRHALTMNSQPHNDPLCYWVLLTDSLHFCYTSPSFNAVVPQARNLIGRPFLDYLNPQTNPPLESITGRLHNCYRDEEGNADVLYLNYATVSAIRLHLHNGAFIPPTDYSFAQFAVVVSRAGGFILVFLHVKAAFSRDCNFHMCEPLKPDDLSGVAPYVPPLDSNPPYHVFQILLDDERRPIIFSTPTTLAGGIAIAPPVLAEGTQSSRDSVTNQGQTSCTKRTKLSFIATTLTGGPAERFCCLTPPRCAYLHVSRLISLITVLGNALLAMYKIIPYDSSPSAASSPVQMRYPPPPGPPNPYQPTHRHTEYRQIPSTSDRYSHPNSVPQPGMPMHQPSYNPSYSPASSHHPRGSSYDSGYPPTSPDDARSPMVSSPRSPVSARSSRGRGIPMRRNSLTDQAAMSTAGQGSLSPQLGSLEEHKVMMHDSQRSGLHSPTESTFIMDRSHGSSSSVTDNDISVNNLRGRPAKEPPKGVTCCRSCQTTVTPEWRKGPTGNKDMCNACGLRWNRRVKKMKGEGANPGDTSFNGLNMVHADTDSLLEPQRAGGGSKKGHRKKTVESRGPALTTRPQKRRYSDASGMSGDALSNSPHDDIPHDSYAGSRHMHPHNPHQSQVNASSSSRPSLPPLFGDDSSNFPPAQHAPSNMQPQTPLTASSISTSGASRIEYHAHRGSINHQMKSPSTPEVTQGYFPPPGHPPPAPADRKPFSTGYARPPGSPPNGSQHYMGLEQAHRGVPQGERPSLEIQGVHGYHQSTEPRHAHSHSHPHFDRHTDPNIPNGANNHPGNSR